MNNDFHNLEVRLIASICTPMVPCRFDLPYPADLQTRSEEMAVIQSTESYYRSFPASRAATTATASRGPSPPPPVSPPSGRRTATSTRRSSASSPTSPRTSEATARPRRRRRRCGGCATCTYSTSWRTTPSRSSSRGSRLDQLYAHRSFCSRGR